MDEAILTSTLSLVDTDEGIFSVKEEITIDEMDLTYIKQEVLEEEYVNTGFPDGPDCKEEEYQDCHSSGNGLENEESLVFEKMCDFTLLPCPACDQTFKGGTRRIPCLIKHVNSHHSRELKRLLASISAVYGKWIDHCQD